MSTLFLRTSVISTIHSRVCISRICDIFVVMFFVCRSSAPVAG